MKQSEMKLLKFSNRFLYSPLKKYDGLIGKLPLVNPLIYLGIEVEAEHVSNKYPPIQIPGSWNVTDDGSLKEWGGEYVSRPIRFKYIEMELRRLFMAIPKAVFSPRTSIHIHMNSRDFTGEELLNFLLLYLIFERNLYDFSGNRWLNNFCIPLHSNTHMAKNAIDRIGVGVLENIPWCKYHGLNILPLTGEEGSSSNYGTIEFRHMVGNNNVEYIMNWCNLIVSLKLAAKKMSREFILDALQYDKCTFVSFVIAVFGDWSHLLQLYLPKNSSMLKESILGTKIICLETGLLSGH